VRRLFSKNKKKVFEERNLPNGEKLNIASITVAELNSLGARSHGSSFLVFREHQVDELTTVWGNQASAFSSGDSTEQNLAGQT
jgi:hypothetical protein